MKVILIVILFCSSTMSGQEISYSLATWQAQQGQWTQAKETLQSLLVPNPDRSDLLYDAGVVAANLQEYEQAEHYFNTAADQAKQKTLQEQAWFNAGNMAAKQQQYQRAIEHYEKTLKLNPNNEHAAHNLKKVKELVEEEQKREKKEEEQKKKEQQKQESSEKDKQSEQQSKREQQERSQMHDGKDQSSAQGADQQQQSQKGSDMKEDSKDSKSKDMTSKQPENNQKKYEQSKNSQPDHTNPSKNNKDTVSTAQHKKENQKKQETKNKEASIAGKQGARMSEQEQKIANILGAVDDHEHDLQKHFTRYIIHQTMGASSHEQGW